MAEATVKQPPINVSVLSHAMVQACHRGRWRALAARHPVDVTLVVPAHWENHWFGDDMVWEPEARAEDRYRVLPLPVTNCRDWGRYRFVGLGRHLKSFQPDVILVYGEEFSLLLQQVIFLRWLTRRQARVAFFTWNNLGLLTGRRRWLKRLFWALVKRGTHMAIAGNARGAELIRQAAYPGRLVTQTEIGVDPADFHPDADARGRIREGLGLEGPVIGFAGRLTAAKGLDDLFDALPQVGGEWSVLLVGDGDLREHLQQRSRSLGHPVVFAGAVGAARMPEYLRAMDCLVLPSRTTPTWAEQFGLVLAQAMACGVPVIGSDSGAIPEVIGEAGIVVPEGDMEALGKAIDSLVTMPDQRRKWAAAGRQRVEMMFSTDALADETYRMMVELLESTPMDPRP